ncbi:hypothetical protein C1H46_041382 [Malus baccata]|uniref:Uncharacterized protein n=1 Tax=Malus baccata TaxID=106549 RepID=A0A540KG07_MALBA|nr:hypothetical protein C1H46_041382 [Malus baccata]
MTMTMKGTSGSYSELLEKQIWKVGERRRGERGKKKEEELTWRDEDGSAGRGAARLKKVDERE